MIAALVDTYIAIGLLAFVAGFYAADISARRARRANRETSRRKS